MSTVQTLSTRISVDGMAAFQSAMNSAQAKVKQTHQTFQNAAQQTTKATEGMFGGGSMALLGKAGMLTAALYAAAKGAQAFGGAIADAVKTSNDFEDLKVALTAITHSAEKADAKLAFIKQLAIPSRYTALQLGAAGLQIEGMQMRLEKVLPLITKLTMGTHRVQEEDQRMAVRIFANMGQGRLPEIEAMTAFGISRSSLAEKGVKFDANGSMLSSAKVGLDALEALIEGRFGDILQKAGDTGSAKMSAAVDMWQQIVAKFGDALKETLLPIIERVGSWLQFVLQSGWLTDFTNAVAGLFGPKANWLDATDLVMANLLVFIQELPKIIGAAMSAIDQVAQGIFTGLWTLWRNVEAYFSSGAMFTTLRNGFVGMATALLALVDDMIALILGPIKPIIDWWMRQHNPQGSTMSGRTAHIPTSYAEWGNRLMGGGKDAEAQKAAWLKANPSQAPNVWRTLIRAALVGVPDFMMGGPAVEQMIARFKAARLQTGLPADKEGGWGTLGSNNPLDVIAKNTGETAANTAKALDFRRAIIGGGSLAALGITPVEIASAGRGRGAAIKVVVETTGRTLQQQIADGVSQAVVGLRRYGYV